MINEYEKFRLVDKTKKNDLYAEVNFKDDEETKDCKVVKFTLGDKAAYVDKKFLNLMLFAIGTEAEQKKMIPMKRTTVTHIERILHIKATKDIKKGEMITIPYTFVMPRVEEEVISEVAKSYKIDKSAIKRKSKIIIP